MLIHTKCGGGVVGRVCKKCGKTWRKIGFMFAQDLEPAPKDRFDPVKYKRRIRNLDDLPR